MEAISKHISGNKITKAKLFALADHLIETNQDLPKIKKSCNKKELCDWFRLNWKLISQSLGTIQNTETNEEDSFI